MISLELLQGLCDTMARVVDSEAAKRYSSPEWNEGFRSACKELRYQLGRVWTEDAALQSPVLPQADPQEGSQGQTK
jgi:hypothetical protein